MKTVRQKIVAVIVAVLLGTVGATSASAGISIGLGGGGISIGFGPRAAGGTYVDEASNNDADASISDSDTDSADEDIPSRPERASRRAAPVQRATSQNTCDTNKKLAEIDSLMSRLKEVQQDVKAGYQDVNAVAEFGRVVVKKLDALTQCTASDQSAKSAIAERYNGVQTIVSQTVSQVTPKPKAGG